MNRSWRRFGCGLIWLLVAVSLVGCGQFWKKRQARHDIRELSRGLEFYRGEQGQYPEGTLAEIAALLRGQSVGQQNRTKRDYIEARPREMNAAGEFIDPWGTPYRLAPGTPLAVYSCGPNQVDEHGAGDDVHE